MAMSIGGSKKKRGHRTWKCFATNDHFYRFALDTRNESADIFDLNTGKVRFVFLFDVVHVFAICTAVLSLVIWRTFFPNEFYGDVLRNNYCVFLDIVIFTNAHCRSFGYPHQARRAFSVSPENSVQLQALRVDLLEVSSFKL